MTPTPTPSPPDADDDPTQEFDIPADIKSTSETASGPACPTCGTPAIPGDVFCESCGGDLPASSASPAPDGDERATEGLDDSMRLTREGDAPHLVCAACGGTFADGWCSTCGSKQPAARDHVERSIPGAAGVTDRGRHHRRNEDAMALRHEDDLVAVVIGDGVSSTVAPDRASQAAVDAALVELLAGAEADTAHRAAQAAASAVDHVPHADLGAPSTTFLAARVRGHEVEVMSLGDCRAYWLTASAATLVTVDDSWAHEQVATGAMTAEQAMADPRAHVITRWLGPDADPAWAPTVRSFTASGPGRLLLCSDGLWNYAPEPADLLDATPTTDLRTAPLLDVARDLVAFANEQGGRDNITVVVVDVPTAPLSTPDNRSPSPTPEVAAGDPTPPEGPS